MQKIVFFDIDGTLVGPSDTIPPSALRTIKALRENGIKTAIATGRSGLEMTVFKKTQPVELFDALIYGNGTMIEMDGKIINRQCIDPKEVADIIQVARENNIAYGVLDNENLRFGVESHPRMQDFLHGIAIRLEPVYDPDYHLTHDIFSGILLTSMDDAHLFEPVLRQCEVVQGIQVGGGIGVHLDFWRKDITKATGISKLVEILGTSMEHVYAVGDGFNDIQMLQEAGVGIAMGNAHPDVQQYADFVTKSYDQDGIEYAMKYFGLI